MFKILLRKAVSFTNRIKGYNYDVPNKNGEYDLLNKVLKLKNQVVFDVGANIGEYASRVLSINNTTNLHCFEPVSATFNELKTTMELHFPDSKVHLNHFGMSNSISQLEIFVYGNTAGINSLYLNEKYIHLRKGSEEKLVKELISLKTLDRYLEDAKIKHIDFLKIDTEGHDSMCLLGGVNALQNGRIKAIQFEYNNYWKIPGYKLKDTIDLLHDNNYELYRLTFWGKIKIRKYSNTLENYLSANYYAVYRE